MRFLKEWFGKKLRFAVLLLLLFGLVVCTAHVGSSVWQEVHTPPEQRVKEALHYAIEAPMYCYTSEAIRIHDGKEQVVTRLSGEKNGEAIHLYGIAETLDTEIDIYQIGEDFYRKDIVSGEWLQMRGQNLEATEYLLQEINPLGCLYLSDNAQVIAQGKERVNGISCRKYQVQSSGEEMFLTSVWSEFYYTVWIDKKHRLQQVEMIADHHEENAEQLQLIIQFDWETSAAEIKAPV